ncbi:MAG: hypothetical protein R3Y68_00615 [Rikenellaceae bacterium]
MKISQHTYDLILANALFGVSYAVVVSILEGQSLRLEPDSIFAVQVVVAAIIFLPHVRLSQLRQHLPHIVRNTIILIFGWQRLTLIGVDSTSTVNVAAISAAGIVVTLCAKRNIHRLREFCAPFAVVILAMPFVADLAGEWFVAAGIVSVAISTILSRDVVRSIGAASALALYSVVALALLPVVAPLNIAHDITHAVTAGGETGLLLLFQSTLGSALPLYLLLRGSAATTPLTTALCRYVQSAVALAICYVPELANVLILIMVAISAVEIFVRCDDE